MSTVTEEQINNSLKQCMDPEVPLSIVDMGLIYGIAVNENNDVDIKMTLTAPGCPVAGVLPGWVADAVVLVEGVGEVEVTLVWSPPWTPDLMSEDARLALDL